MRPRTTSPWRRGALVLLAANVGTQLVVAASAPVLSRLYGPYEFGALTVVVTIAALLVPVSTLRLDLAVVQPEAEEDAYALAYAGIVCASVVSAFTLLGLVFAGRDLARALDQPALWPSVLLVPPIVLAGGVFLSLSQLAVRQKRFRAVATRNVAKDSAAVGTQIGLGLAGGGSGSLVLGHLVGQTVGAGALLVSAGVRTPASRAGLAWSRMRTAVGRYRSFVLHLGPAALLNVAGLQVPILLVAAFYGAEVTGWLGLTMRVLVIPALVVGTAAAQLYRSRFSEMVRHRQREQGHALFVRTTLLLLPVGLIPAVVLLAAGPELFAVVFGEEWRTSGRYAQALAFVLAAQAVVVPVSTTLVLLERTLAQVGWDAVRLLVCCAAVLVPAAAGATASVAVWALGTVSALTYAWMWWACERAVRSYTPRQPENNR